MLTRSYRIVENTPRVVRSSLTLYVCLYVFSPSGNLDKQTDFGNTALHYCCMYEKPECLKLLLRGKPATDISESHVKVHPLVNVSCAHISVSNC